MLELEEVYLEDSETDSQCLFAKSEVIEVNSVYTEEVKDREGLAWVKS